MTHRYSFPIRFLPVKNALLQTCLTLALGLTALTADAAQTLQRPEGSQTSMTMHGAPKYPEGFRHYDYVNPEAPKGGALRMTAMGTFDSLNPFIEKGTSVAATAYMYDTLMAASYDEPFTMYPLLAQYVEMAPDNSSITFHLNPKARFHDGHPVTAEDVVFSLNTLLEKGTPFYRAYYGDIEKAEALSRYSVRFVFKHNQNRELPLIISQMTVLPKHFWEKEENDFQAANMSIPLGSGPYKIKSVDSGRSIEYQRVEDYWGKDLPVNVGRYNFDTIQLDYFRDENVALQATKAGKYNVRFEYSALNWATAYDIPATRNGELILESIKTLSPQGMQGFAYNTRRELFQNPKVRKALMAAFDFEWLNKNLFFNSYYRTNSYFANSTMSATGIPEGKELALLKPFSDQLPKELFTEPYTLPVYDGSGQIRSQIRNSLSLLSEAGWKLENGVLRNDKGEPFKFEILLIQSSMERVALAFKKNLEQLGVDATIRVVDASQYINRLRKFDYDMIVYRYGQSSSPGNEQRDFWGSAAADVPGSRNYMGIKNPVVDQLVDHLIHADSREDLETAVKALDRVLLWGEYMIPQYYYPNVRVAYWQPLEHPFKPTLDGSEAPQLYNFDLDSWWMGTEPTSVVAATDTSEAPSENELSGKTALWVALLVVLGLLVRFLNRRRSRNNA
ncbi:extracellular solute-binding protein [Endozoicomonas gorgoniicola]|uniref:Extracellular solute-binding protein n=1 Tax=Endozoicomonas gorgoniicola TaxID=1234144 RepID=A0ABT3MT42_9GAMM|nr:extracellular solute-binding protein [Endozoicomonas gorgoniicola]MCW7552518.1 extracellular solute-binding protein [Endozoicomonas gorgoniicola]